MRLRFTVLASVLVAFALCSGSRHRRRRPPARSRPDDPRRAAPHHRRRGRPDLRPAEGADHANQMIRLYHRINPSPRFSLISATRTDPTGRYEFTRAEGIVMTNRSWFVRGPVLTHSRTVHERVAALVSLATSPARPPELTRHPIVFSGHLTPDHAGSVVLLQVQKGSSDDWRTLKRGRRRPRLQLPDRLRLADAGCARRARRVPRRRAQHAGASDPVAVVIQQTQVPGFTINTSDPIVSQQHAVDDLRRRCISRAARPRLSRAPASSCSRREPGAARFRELSRPSRPVADGSYSFTDQRRRRTSCTRCAPSPRRARLTAQSCSRACRTWSPWRRAPPTSTVGGQITFTGNVSPDKAGHVIYLQKLGTGR